VLSGCIGISPKEGISVDSPSIGERDSNGGTPTQSETIQKQIPNQEYVYYEFSVNKPRIIQYSLTTENGVPVDVFITDEENFQNFHERSPWKYYQTGSSMNTKAPKNSFILGTDRTYYLVIDNSREGNVTTIPSDRPPITISGEIELRSPK
jgi:hypothetical protein